MRQIKHRLAAMLTTNHCTPSVQVEVPLQPEEPADTQGQNEEQHYAEPMPEQQEEIEALQV